VKILISRLSALGDTVCTLPVAVALKTTFPESHITWAVDARFAGIVECCASIDEVIRVKPGLQPSSWPRFASQFDLALDMQGLLKSAIVVGCAKADKKLGYHWQREFSCLFTQKVIPDPSSLHVVDQYVDVARAAGAEASQAIFNLHPKPDDRAKCIELLKESGIEGPFIVLNAGAGWATKRWPSAHFASLADSLAGKNIATVLIGGRADADQTAAGEVIQSSKNPPINLLGKTNVRELVALISLANAHVGGDTGSTHIAAALGVPAVGLYSITKPHRSCPYGQIDRCHYDESSLANIFPADVLQTVSRVMT
jgi:heptosyltransferase I